MTGNLQNSEFLIESQEQVALLAEQKFLIAISISFGQIGFAFGTL